MASNHLSKLRSVMPRVLDITGGGLRVRLVHKQDSAQTLENVIAKREAYSVKERAALQGLADAAFKLKVDAQKVGADFDWSRFYVEMNGDDFTIAAMDDPAPDGKPLKYILHLE